MLSESKAQKAAAPEAQFPVVGIGASAGGLAATAQLLQEIGKNPGISLLVVQHLDPAHESNLAAILARSTTLPVITASDGLLLELDHVYVVPPNAGLILDGDRLRLIPRNAHNGPHHPIDRLFHSLAAERGALAVGVVLSGTGSDGSIGVKAIKAAGGIALAQDSSAEFAGMPNAAEATGCVDLVLTPKGLADELRRIGASPRAAPQSLGGEEQSLGGDEQFRRVLGALRRVSGVDFAGYKESTIRRRVQRRVFLRQMTQLDDYLDLLEREPLEAKALGEEVLIHVTSFFRDAQVFEALKALVFPRLLSSARGAPIRIWVPGCSTGEEAYSIAMCLLEFLTDAGAADVPIKIFGTDVSVASVDSARAARYSEGIEHDVSPGRLEAFFTHTSGAYRIKKGVRDVCVFARHDATRDPPFSRMDLISCRNLMIYLTPALQDRLLPMFHYALKEPGFLLLGTSESARSCPGFATLDGEHKLYSRTPVATRPAFDFSFPNLPDPVAGGASSKPASASDILREADRVVLAGLEPPGVVVTDELAIIQFRGKTGRYLEPAPGAARFDLLRMAREDLRLPLRQVIDQARVKRASARLRVPPLGGASTRLEVEAIPFGLGMPQGYFVVLFCELDAVTTSDADSPLQAAPSVAEPSVEEQLRGELTSTREYLQSLIERLEATNEELRAANEEITSSNEELRSTNEELEVAKEELQATNQELLTVNDEMVVRNHDANRLNDDLTNVFGNVGVPVLLLDRDSTIRRFTPAAEKILGLISSDVGQPLADRRGPFTSECARLAREVMDTLQPIERPMQDDSGRSHLFVARPYLTLDRRVDGTIVTIFDVDAIAGLAFRDVLTGASEAILLTDSNGRIAFANHAAARLFGYTAAELLGSPVEALVPDALRAQHAEQRKQYLSEPLARPMAADRDVQGRRKDGSSFPIEVALNPTRHADGAMILAFVTDISKRREAEQEIRSYQERLQHMAFDAAVAEERERRRIAVDLHDHIGQTLALASIKLSGSRELVTGPARDAMEAALELVAQSVVAARTLTFDLSPPILYDLGLKEALSWLAEDVERRYGIVTTLHVDAAPTPLDDASAALVFRAVRELLFNVFKHAKSSTASLSIKRAAERLCIEVEDRGVGFDAAAPPQANGGFGLFSVREQIRRLGGVMEVSSNPQQGTRVTLRVPLARKDSATAGESTPRAVVV